jgi:hypothetical protein
VVREVDDTMRRRWRKGEEQTVGLEFEERREGRCNGLDGSCDIAFKWKLKDVVDWIELSEC